MTDQTAADSVLAKVQGALPDGIQEQAQQAVGRVSGQITSQVREQLGTRSTQAGEQLTSVSSALRTTTEQLRSAGNEAPAQLLSPVVDKAEQLGEYLRGADADRLLHDLEDFGRKQPWTVIVGGIAAGFLASRFLRASSSRRYEQRSPVSAPTVYDPMSRDRRGGASR